MFREIPNSGDTVVIFGVCMCTKLTTIVSKVDNNQKCNNRHFFERASTIRNKQERLVIVDDLMR